MKPILVHCHIYYKDMWPELKQCISNIAPYPFDLYVTMVEEHKDIISDINKNFPQAKIEIVENRGYDIGPFIHVINQVNLIDYSYVVKIHTKSDKPNPTYLLGFNASDDRWRKELLKFTENWTETISFMESNHNVGMASGANVIITRDEDLENEVKMKADNWVKKLDFAVDNNKEYSFVAGTMFILKADLLSKLQHKVELKDFEYSSESKKSLAHIMERIFGMIVCYSGYKICDVQGLYPHCKVINKIKNFVVRFTRFFYQKKITRKGDMIIKILKIPVYHQKRLLEIGK